MSGASVIARTDRNAEVLGERRESLNDLGEITRGRVADDWQHHPARLLRGVEDKEYEGKLYSLLGFTDLSAKSPQKVVFDPKTDKSFPANMTISSNPTWTEDLSALVFGIHDLKKKEQRPGSGAGVSGLNGGFEADEAPRSQTPVWERVCAKLCFEDSAGM